MVLLIRQQLILMVQSRAHTSVWGFRHIATCLRQEQITSWLSVLISQLNKSCQQILRFINGDRQPNRMLQWYDLILSVKSGRPFRLENVIKSFVLVFPVLRWSCLLVWNKASGIKGICCPSLCWNTCLLEGELQI